MVSSHVYPSLERKPGGGDNWVEKAGGLPDYIERIAKHLHYEQGMSIRHAIAAAITTCRRWAAGGGDVKADTRAKAGKALAEWEAKRGANAARKAATVNLSGGHFDVRDMIDLSTLAGPETFETLDLAAEAASDGAVILDLSALSDEDAALVIDLAPGDYRRPYDWKHGYIPITPAAALSKAKGDRKRAAKLLKSGGAMSPGDAARAVKGMPTTRGRRKVAGERRRPTEPMKPASTPEADAAARGRGIASERAASDKSRARRNHLADSGIISREQADRENARTAGPSNAEKIKNAETMFGTGSKQHKAAQQRFGGDRSPAMGGSAAAPNPGNRNRGADAAAAGKKIDTADLEAGQVIEERSPITGKTKRLRLDKVYSADREGNRNADVTDLDTGKSQGLTLMPGRKHNVTETGRGDASVTPIGGRRQTPQEKWDTAPKRHAEGDRVSTEYGHGTVEKATPGSMVIKLDNGETIGVRTGTPGYNRVKALSPADDSRGADGFPKSGPKRPQDMTGPEIVAEQERLSNYLRGMAGGTATPADRERWQARRRELETERQKRVRDGMRSHPDNAARQGRAAGTVPPKAGAGAESPAILPQHATKPNSELRRITERHPDPAVKASAKAELDRRAAGGSTIKMRDAAKPADRIPPGTPVKAQNPGGLATTDGVLVGYDDNGWPRVEHTIGTGRRVTGTFNPNGVETHDGRKAAPSAHDMPAETRSVKDRADWQRNNPEAVKQAAPASPAADATTSSTKSTNPDATMRVEHTPDGTLVHGTDRGDTEANAALKEAGFKWSRNLGAWYLPRTWNESTREQRVRRLEGKLGDRLGVDRTTGPRKSAAEREAETRDRAAARAERMDARAQRASAESESRRKAADAITDHIPMGQPILVGHHSERKHRRDLERAHSNTQKSWEAQKEADRATQAAERARRTAAGDESKVTIGNRIDRNEAALRSAERKLKDDEQARSIIAKVGEDSRAGQVAATMRISPEYRAQLERQRAELRDTIDHDKGKLEAAGGVAHSKDTLEAGDFVKIRGQWYPVTRTNAKTVTVPSIVGGSWTDTSPYREIQDVKRARDMTPEQLDKLAGAQKHDGARKVLEKRAAAARKAGRSAGGSDTGQTTAKAGPSAGERLKGQQAESEAAYQAEVARRAEARSGAITEATARRMSDQQLEDALGRLFAAGGTDTPSIQALEKELDRRDREAANRGKGEAATPAAATAEDRKLDDLTYQADRNRTKFTPDVIDRLSEDQLHRSIGSLMAGGYDANDHPVRDMIDTLERKHGAKAARPYRGVDAKRRELDEKAARRAQHGTVAQQQSAYREWVQAQASRMESDDTVGAHALAAGSRSGAKSGRGSGAMTAADLFTMTPAQIRANASEEALRWFGQPGNEPLPFDAWRAVHLGATDRRAVESLRRRREQWLSEFG